jgi:hypothetical protein
VRFRETKGLAEWKGSKEYWEKSRSLGVSAGTGGPGRGAVRLEWRRREEGGAQGYRIGARMSGGRGEGTPGTRSWGRGVPGTDTAVLLNTQKTFEQTYKGSNFCIP